MEEALPLAKNFNDAHAKFIDWLVKMEPKSRLKDTNEPEEQVMVRGFLLKYNIKLNMFIAYFEVFFVVFFSEKKFL